MNKNNIINNLGPTLFDSDNNAFSNDDCFLDRVIIDDDTKELIIADKISKSKSHTDCNISGDLNKVIDYLINIRDKYSKKYIFIIIITRFAFLSNYLYHNIIGIRKLTKKEENRYHAIHAKMKIEKQNERMEHFLRVEKEYKSLCKQIKDGELE